MPPTSNDPPRELQDDEPARISSLDGNPHRYHGGDAFARFTLHQYSQQSPTTEIAPTSADISVEDSVTRQQRPPRLYISGAYPYCQPLSISPGDTSVSAPHGRRFLTSRSHRAVDYEATRSSGREPLPVAADLDAWRPEKEWNLKAALDFDSLTSFSVWSQPQASSNYGLPRTKESLPPRPTPPASSDAAKVSRSGAKSADIPHRHKSSAPIGSGSSGHPWSSKALAPVLCSSTTNESPSGHSYEDAQDSHASSCAAKPLGTGCVPASKNMSPSCCPKFKLAGTSQRAKPPVMSSAEICLSEVKRADLHSVAGKKSLPTAWNADSNAAPLSAPKSMLDSTHASSVDCISSVDYINYDYLKRWPNAKVMSVSALAESLQTVPSQYLSRMNIPRIVPDLTSKNPAASRAWEAWNYHDRFVVGRNYHANLEEEEEEEEEGEEDLYGVSDNESSAPRPVQSDFDESTATLIEDEPQSGSVWESYKKDDEPDASSKMVTSDVQRREPAERFKRRTKTATCIDLKISSKRGDVGIGAKDHKSGSGFNAMPGVTESLSSTDLPAEPSRIKDAEPRAVLIPTKQKNVPAGGKGKRPLTGPRAMSSGSPQSSHYAGSIYSRPERWGEFGTRYSPPIGLQEKATPPTGTCDDCGKPLTFICKHELARSGWVDADEEMAKNGDGIGGESGFEADNEICHSDGDWDLV